MPLNETLLRVVKELNLIEGSVRAIAATLETFRNETPEAPPVVPEPSEDLHEDLMYPPPERSRAEVIELRRSPGTPVPDGIYRLCLDQPLDPAVHIPGGVTLKAQNPKKVWLLLSRNWAPGGEAGCNWTQTGSYWTSSRSVPNIGTNEPNGVSYEDRDKALRYEMCVGIKADGSVLRFASIAQFGTPGANQFCLDNTRKIRLGRNPNEFVRLEVVEVPTGPGRWFWPDGDGVTLEGIVMRYAPSGPSADPAGSHDRHQLTMKNCVIGDVHGTALNLGGSRDVRVEDCLIEQAGNTGISSYNVNGLRLARNQIYACGYGGWDVLWQGGATKFTVTTNQVIEDIKIKGCRGSGLWWDESAYGPISVSRADVRDCAGPLFHYEICTGPVTVRDSVFAYNTYGPGWPVFYISSSTGPGEITNCLIISGSNTRGLQAYWAQDRSNDRVVRDWTWKDCRFIQEGPEAAVFIGGGAEGQSNQGSGNQYYFAGSPRWTAGLEFRSVDSWNASKFEENARLVDKATADGWRAANGV